MPPKIGGEHGIALHAQLRTQNREFNKDSAFFSVVIFHIASNKVGFGPTNGNVAKANLQIMPYKDGRMRVVCGCLRMPLFVCPYRGVRDQFAGVGVPALYEASRGV